MLFNVIQKASCHFLLSYFLMVCTDLLNSNKRRTILNGRINAAFIYGFSFKFQTCVYWSGLFCTLLHEVLKHRKRVGTFLRVCNRAGHALRVPLYGPDRKSLVLHSLCEGVSVGLAPCDGLETFAELVEGLVVVAVYFHGLAVKVS